MRLKQDGYLIPDLPVDYIAARSEKEAKQILLAHASQYGNVDSQGLYEFISKADIGIDEMMQSSSFPEIDLDAFKAEFLDDPAAEQGNGDADAVPEIPKNVHNVQRGQIWQLGEHRLMCGDSTSKEDVAKLMDGQKADMVFTDPPYGVSYQSNMRTKTEKFDVLKNDEIFIDGWLPHAGTFSTGWVFIWTTWKVLQKWFDITNDFAPLTNMVVWDKGGGGIGDLEKTFSTDYEIALVFNRGAKITGKRLGSVWDIGKDAASEYLHPTQKPVALCVMALENCTHSKALVLDFFGGSGSTLIACEKTKRVNYSMELDEHYCSVIIERWQQFTGQTAALLQPSP